MELVVGLIGFLLNIQPYELSITIPVKKESSTCSDKRALQTGPSGIFEFIVLKKNLSDDSGFCVHRFYKDNK